jgi:hypothetical protein
MTIRDIVDLRLHNQHLSHPDLKTPADVVKHFGAVQAQDYPAARWSLGLRMQDATDAIIEEAYNNGSILRTHVMRPTWHFVLPENIRWMQELTAANVKKQIGHYNRKIELTDELLEKTNKLISKALANNNFLTRKEIKGLLEGIGVKTDVQRLAHILVEAELGGIICSGPRRGKQFTYALIDERVPATKSLSREEGLAKLAKMYFTSHGPAQIKDFSWWSGLTVKDATYAVELAKKDFMQETIEDKTYWYVPTKTIIKEPSPTAHLLSIYDEYTIAYRDRSALGRERYVEKFIAMGNALTAVMILDGQIVGTWKRILKKDTVEMFRSPLRTLQPEEIQAFNQAETRYKKFFLGDK